MSAKTQHHNILLAIAGLVAAVVIVGLIGFFTLGQTKEILQGEVEVSEFRVSCKLPGRIVELRVKEGDYVHVGDTLAIHEIPEANAQEKKRFNRLFSFTNRHKQQLKLLIKLILACRISMTKA